MLEYPAHARISHSVCTCTRTHITLCTAAAAGRRRRPPDAAPGRGMLATPAAGGVWRFFSRWMMPSWHTPQRRAGLRTCGEVDPVEHRRAQKTEEHTEETVRNTRSAERFHGTSVSTICPYTRKAQVLIGSSVGQFSAIGCQGFSTEDHTSPLWTQRTALYWVRDGIP